MVRAQVSRAEMRVRVGKGTTEGKTPDLLVEPPSGLRLRERRPAVWLGKMQLALPAGFPRVEGCRAQPVSGSLAVAHITCPP